jgi:nucleoside-diphosphate-sugar epimerase
VKFLVTGGTGYIGSSLVRRLVALGHQVGVFVRAGSGTEALQSCIGKVRLFSYDGSMAAVTRGVEAFAPDQVYHIASLFLARHRREDVDRLVAANILFPAQLLEAMNAAGVKRLINVGTSWQHYQDAPYNPVNLYAATKQAFEDVLEYYVQAQAFQAITLKLYDSYGPGDFRPKLFALLRKAAKSGAPLKMSPGRQKLDLVYIEDILAAFEIASQRLFSIAKAETYGIRSRQPIALQDLVGIYSEVVGRPVPVLWGDVPYRLREVMEPWTGSVPLPGWKAVTALRDGIARMEHDPAIGGLLAKPGL